MTRVQKHEHEPQLISEIPGEDWLLWSCRKYACLWLRTSKRDPDLMKLAASTKRPYPMLSAAKKAADARAAAISGSATPDAASFSQSIPIP